MIFVDQTKFGQKEGNCFSACVATILGMTIEEVPLFASKKTWFADFEEWLRPQGFYPLNFDIPNKDQSNMKWYGVHILGGKSPRDLPYPECMHAVVGCGAEIIHDPHPSRDGIETFDDFLLIVKGVKQWP